MEVIRSTFLAPAAFSPVTEVLASLLPSENRQLEMAGPAIPASGNQRLSAGLLALPGGYAHPFPTSSTVSLSNGQGWIPLNFSRMSTGSPWGGCPQIP